MIKGGDNDSIHKRVFNQETAETEKSIMETVVSTGTGRSAQTGAEGEWGKTGTTENSGDAWFCGGIKDEVTACVWVGYADTTTPMETLYNGGPVMGGTFPALIWQRVITAWEEIKKEHLAEKRAREARKEAKANGAKPEEVEEIESEVAEEEGEVEYRIRIRAAGRRSRRRSGAGRRRRDRGEAGCRSRRSARSRRRSGARRSGAA